MMISHRIHATPTHRPGFTIVELLVVLSIILLLLAILLPSFRTARAQASRVECQARQKQLMTAIYLYASDRFTMLPDSKQKFVQWRSTSEFWLIVDEYAGGVADVWDCPRYDFRLWNADGTRYGNSDRVHQGGLYLAGKKGHASYWPTLGKEWYSPSKTIDNGSWEVIADRQAQPKSPWNSRVVHGSEQEDLLMYPFGTPLDEIGLVGTNVGRLDGSVHWKQRNEIIPHMNTSGTQYYW